MRDLQPVNYGGRKVMRPEGSLTVTARGLMLRYYPLWTITVFKVLSSYGCTSSYPHKRRLLLSDHTTWDLTKVLSALGPNRLVARPGLSPAHVNPANPHGFIPAQPEECLPP
ncbi:hypothetical protein ACLOJK_034984, partial [Asimina triloba]